MHRLLVVIIAAFLSLGKAWSQELVLVRDTVNNLQIGVPSGWKCAVLVDQMVDFIAYRQKIDADDVLIESFNINIFPSENKNFNSSFKWYIKSISDAKGFKILEQGNQKINLRKYKYLIESHENDLNGVPMINYNFFTNDKGRVVILTMVSYPDRFANYRDLFSQIALSLRF